MAEVEFPWVLALVALTLITAALLHRAPELVAYECNKALIESLAVAVNVRDRITHAHVARVRIYAAGMGQLLYCSPAELQALHDGAILHDVGKIGIPDHILHKPGQLTPEEFTVMKTHTVLGAQMVEQIGAPLLISVVRSHHERWDGGGYPDALAGEEIPRVARILAVVDCFDAFRSERPYKAAFSEAESLCLLMAGAGKQFDPSLPALFKRHLPEFKVRIASMPAAHFLFLGPEIMPAQAVAAAPATGFAAPSRERLDA